MRNAVDSKRQTAYDRETVFRQIGNDSLSVARSVFGDPARSNDRDCARVFLQEGTAHIEKLRRRVERP